MKRIRYGRIAAIVTAGALALTACGNDPAADSGSGGGDNVSESSLSGTLAGSGATSMESAQNAWAAKFMAQNPDVDLSYDPVGSGGGRTAFLDGGVAFAGSDSALDEEERAKAKDRCAGGDAYDLPLYISPIAVVYNLPEVKELNLAPSTIAKIFDGKIAKWNDPAIAADNAGATLPDLAITPVNRSDESGTTKNFTEYLSKTAGADWPHEPSGDWPRQGTQSAQGTSGVVQTVQGGKGTIAYADHSQAGSLGVAKIKVGEKFVEPTAEGAAKVVEESPKKEGLPEHALAIDLKRDTTTDGAYPLVLVSYIVVCSKYEDTAQGDLVTAYVTYIASAEGQQVAADEAGSAPISDALRTEVEAALKSIA
ncbi:MAG: phosphate ABC transporter substrate-binding protein PstS [Actinophytocola sp.]|uniref:phosphate ABC transporter substrate-binding protein PstS n=1 Tax=Actinophytocola sp. TaxID=1872138 RepID=UPI003C7699EF